MTDRTTVSVLPYEWDGAGVHFQCSQGCDDVYMRSDSKPSRSRLRFFVKEHCKQKHTGMSLARRWAPHAQGRACKRTDTKTMSAFMETARLVFPTSLMSNRGRARPATYRQRRPAPIELPETREDDDSVLMMMT